MIGAALLLAFSATFPSLSAAEPAGVPAGHVGPVRALAIDFNNNRLLSGGFDHLVRLWDFDSLRPGPAFDGHDGAVNAIRFLDGGRRAVSAGDDGAILLWDLESRHVVKRLQGHQGKIADLVVSGNGRWLASAGWDGTVRLWDMTRGGQSQVLALPVDYHALAFANDGGMLWCADREGRLTLVATQSGEIIKRIDGAGFAVLDLALLPDGQRMVTAGADGTVRLRSLADGSELMRLEGHEGPVLHVAMVTLLDGSTSLISAGADGRWILWDLERQRIVRQRFSRGGPVWALAVSRDGRFAVTGHGDGGLRMWFLADASLIRESMEPSPKAGRPFDKSDPGAKAFRACSVCHALRADAPQRAGPHLESLFGRQVGAVAGYRYSQALVAADFQWTEERLKALFRLGPDKYLPGTKMPVQKITNDESLEALVLFLKRVTVPGLAPGIKAEGMKIVPEK